MPKRKRRDNNHGEVVGWFNDLYFSVQDTSQLGDSFPDLVVAKHGFNVLVEIKGEKGKLSEGQIDFMETWHGSVHVVRTQDDCMSLDIYLRRLANDIKMQKVARRGTTMQWKSKKG